MGGGGGRSQKLLNKMSMIIMIRMIIMIQLIIKIVSLLLHLIPMIKTLNQMQKIATSVRRR